jgi:hypothetical protein
MIEEITYRIASRSDFPREYANRFESDPVNRSQSGGQTVDWRKLHNVLRPITLLVRLSQSTCHMKQPPLSDHVLTTTMMTGCDHSVVMNDASQEVCGTKANSTRTGRDDRTCLRRHDAFVMPIYPFAVRPKTAFRRQLGPHLTLAVSCSCFAVSPSCQ